MIYAETKQLTTMVERDMQIDKMQRHITEVCDCEVRKQNQEWVKRLQRERQGESPPQKPK